MISKTLGLAFGVVLAFGASAPLAFADAVSFDFEAPAYTTGSINGQNGWGGSNGTPIGSTYDQGIVDNTTYGYSGIGTQSFRMSNAVISGSFGDWVFSPSVSEAAGETGAVNDAFSSAATHNHFEAEFTFAVATTTGNEQLGAALYVSPDRGDGARMSYVRLEDRLDGVHVMFDDYSGGDFNETDITAAAPLGRSATHTLKFSIDLVDGAGNDIVKLYIDGTLAHVGTSWEDYFRDNQPEVAPPTIDSLLFQERGTIPAAPDTAGAGFLVDNISIVTSDVTLTTPSTVVVDDDFSPDIFGQTENVNGTDYYYGIDAFSTIQDGIDAVAVGGTINVAPGTYSEPLAACGSNQASLCITKSLVLRGDPGDVSAGPGVSAPVLDGGNANGSTIAFSGSVSDVTIEGFEIRNYANPGGTGGIGSGVLAWYADTSNITVQDNYLHNLGWNGILVGSDDGSLQSGWTIRRNVIEDAAYAGIELTNVNNSTVSGNVIAVSNGNWDAGDSGVGIEVAVRDHGSGVTAGDTIGITVSDNTITGGGPGARAGINILSRAYQVTSNARLMNVTIENNTINGVTPRGILVAAEQRNGGAASIAALQMSGNTVTVNEVGVAVGVPTGSSGVDGGYELFVNGNSVSGNTSAGVQNTSGVLFDAASNWWGTASSTEIAAKVSGAVNYTPWYLNPSMSVLSNAVTDGAVDSTTANFDVAGTNSGTADMPEGVTDITLANDTALDLSSELSGDSVTLNSGVPDEPVVLTNTSLAGVSASIPDDTTITAAGWDGILAPPTLGTSSGIALPGFVVGGTVINVGSSDAVLVFDKPVTLTLAGVTGPVGYKPAGSLVWTKIGTVCGGEYASPTDPVSGECAISNGTDTKILTYHFTTFASLVANLSGPGSVGGSGGGGGGSIAAIPATPATPATPTVSPATPATPAVPAQGQVLGAERYNFTMALSVGVRGEEVTELQKVLIAEGLLKIDAPTGYFGQLTREAVIAFQKSRGIAQAGVVGPLTRAELNKGAIVSAVAKTNLTVAQTDAIIAIIESFGADAAVLAKVKAALGR